MSAHSIKVYYDGLCHLCYREIEHYRKCKGAEKVEFVDITASQFSASAEGLDPVAVNKHLHVRKSDGTLAVGIDAFIAIWETLPRFKPLAQAAKVAPVKAVLKVAYAGFAKVRPYLPKRSCEGSPHCSLERR